jgi:transposase
MIVVDHDTGRLVWAGKGRQKATLHEFFDLLGERRCQKVELVSADAAEFIATVVSQRCPKATICTDPFTS